MSVLKWQRGANEWVTLYGTVLKNRLRKDKNLADLTDAAEAKKNLGLVGDVTDHNHDSRYMVLINKVQDDIDREINDRKQREDSFYDELRAQIDGEVSAAVTRYDVSIKKEAKERKKADADLTITIDQKVNDRNLAIQKEADARAADKAEIEREIDAQRSRWLSDIGDAEKRSDDKLAEQMKAVPKEAKARSDGDEAEAKARENADEKLRSALMSRVDAEVTDRDAAISIARQDLTELIKKESEERKMHVRNLQAEDESIKQKMEDRYIELLNLMNGKFQNFHVGDKAPSNPVNGQTVWFFTGEGEESIRVYLKDRWITFGACFL